MSSAKSTVRTISLSFLGALLALGVTGMLPHNEAEAQRPGRLARCQQDLQRAEADLAAYQSAYQELLAGLDKVERINERQPRNLRKRIRKTVRRARNRAGQFVVIAPGPAPAPPAAPAPPPAPAPDPGFEPPPGPAPEIMAPRAFSRLLKSVKKNAFAKERLALIQEAARYHYFSVRQVIRLMNACSFESTRIDVAATLYRNTLDVENWFQVYDAFKFVSSREKLQRRIQ